MSGLQRSASARRMFSPLTKMKRTHTATGSLGTPVGTDPPAFPSPFGNTDAQEAEDHDAADRPEADAGAAGTLRNLLPKSHIFTWSCEHFSRSLLEPPPGAGGYGDDDCGVFGGGYGEGGYGGGGGGGGVYGFGGYGGGGAGGGGGGGGGGGPAAPLQRRAVLDPAKRLERRRVAAECENRSRRAKKEHLKLTEQLASIDMENSVVPTCLLVHPLVWRCKLNR